MIGVSLSVMEGLKVMTTAMGYGTSAVINPDSSFKYSAVFSCRTEPMAENVTCILFSFSNYFFKPGPCICWTGMFSFMLICLWKLLCLLKKIWSLVCIYKGCTFFESIILIRRKKTFIFSSVLPLLRSVFKFMKEMPFKRRLQLVSGVFPIWKIGNIFGKQWGEGWDVSSNLPGLWLFGLGGLLKQSTNPERTWGTSFKGLKIV